MDSNQAEIASIGEEMDENFLFNDSDSLNRSVTSLASLASSAGERANSSDSKKQVKPRGFTTLSRLWNKKNVTPPNHRHTVDQHLENTNCQCQECSNSSKILSSTVSAMAHGVPKIKCSMIPTNPTDNGVASSWTYGYQIPFKHNNSFSSVDEEEDFSYLSSTHNNQDNHLRPSPPSKSRLSLNLVGKDKSSSPKSPRRLSKFLRSSFSKLMQLSNTESNTDPAAISGVATPSGSIRRGQSISSLDKYENSPLEQHPPGHPDHNDVMSPTTLAYLEEAKMSGLPVIPFAYPTCVLVDKIKNKNNVMSTLATPTKEKNNRSNNTGGNSQKISVNSAVSTLTNESNGGFVEFCEEQPKSPPGTLESIVDIAQREYREEQPGTDLELEEDFFCGSVGSAISTLPPESLNNNNLIPRSRIVQANWDEAEIPNFVEDSHMADLMTSQRWHDYLDMNKKYTTNNPRSEPISITDKH